MAMAKALAPWPINAVLLSARPAALSARRRTLGCAPGCLQATRAVMATERKEFQRPLGISRTFTLTPALNIEEAMAALSSYIAELNSPPFQSGILRFQVPLPNNVNLLQWLHCQPESHYLLPQVYFSGRYPPHSSSESCSQVAGLGSAVLFRGTEPFNEQHWKSINRFLSDASPFLKAYGAMRFDPDVKASAEWEAFGTYYFFVPRVELYETSSNTFLAANLTWGDISYEAAVEVLLLTLDQVSLQVSPTSGRLHFTKIHKQHTPDQLAWHSSIDNILSALQDAGDLTKVVMARRTDMQVDGEVRPYCLLALLQEQNPSAYQFCIRLPDGSAFLGNTPEQLFARNGVSVTSEAVAATRPRGATSKDEQQIVLDLLQSVKDNSEFQIVEDAVRNGLESVCQDVQVLMQKGLVKQPNVQHLCTRFSGELVGRTSEFKLLTTLHPTPAVCGYPYASAQALIRSSEPFDRGMYAGPVGWFGGQGAEFAVGIRSCLIHPAENAPAKISLYAGVGVVEGSKALSEWDELELKISQFEQLLQPSKDLEDAVNINMLWSNLIVEECCRLGVTYFCISPGSRSSPLAEAASANPRVSCVSCLDERSLAYYALGFGRGCRRPAAVVVTSGTAVSNLLPAVVEASQDCVPLLILSADRPHELRDTGSNQTINQVQHFGGYTRYHFDLPAATDEVPARMVLTTLDAAIYRASSVPEGPVHINCPFREPLEGVFQSWDHRCLDGLSQWVRSSSPFTTYVPSRLCPLDYASNSQMKAVASLVSNAKMGLLVIGGLKQEEPACAVLKLAKHLNWPLVPDILSGIKLAAKGEDTNVIFNFDQILLHETSQSSLAPDVILQIGSRITSKRLGQFLNKCSPDAFILVDDHPYRHDSGHKLTHRVNCNITEFMRMLLKIKPEPQEESYLCWLRLLNDAVRRELSFHLLSEGAITEPWIARVFSSSVSRDSAIFLGNSMPIRDVDMYGENYPTDDFAVTIRCDANRGASGIDGVLSTAVGFAAGTKKRVTILLGDVSFLHDTNGLTLLGREGVPVTVVLVNNHGGAIFSLLPVANYMADVPFKTLLSTCHEVQIRQLCAAHGVHHVSVESKDQFIEVLESVRSSQSNWVVEIESNIQYNADFHRHLQQEMNSHLTFVLSKLSSQSRGKIKLTEVDIFRYRFPLEAPVTTNVHRREREGYILRITFASGHFGLGEIAPLEGLHEESLKDAEVQLRFLQQRLRAAQVDETVVLLDGSISEWIWKRLKIQPESIFPSVRCGLEMAVLEALASWKGCTLFALLNRAAGPTSEAIHVCGLIDSQDKVDEVAEIAARLVREKCFTTLKFKVARRASALEDAEVLTAVRRKVGPDVRLRADANRRWTLAQALEFAKAVEDCKLEYLEEPLQDISELKILLEQVQMPVAIDESLDLNAAEFPKFLQSNHSRHMVAAIIKPSKVGGFEKARMLSRLSHKWKMNAVISASFESSIALAAYAQFAAACTGSSVAHGLGTFMWLKGDVVNERFGGVVRRGAIAPSEAGQIKRKVRMDLMERVTSPSRRTFTIVAHQYRLRVIETKPVESVDAILVFLHGLLGRAEEWMAVMESLGSSYRCLSIELPGHGQSQGPEGQSIESLGDALSKALKQLSKDQRVVLVGYSLGARLALYMSVHAVDHLEAVVSISGSPGLRSENARRERALQDEELADSLRVAGLSYFISTWYEKPLWKSLRCHPDFKAVQEARLLHDDISALADTIQSLSVGRQRSLWDELAEAKTPVLVVTGSLDKKFVSIGHEMSNANHRVKHVQLPGSGHAVHVECPLLFIRTLTRWLETEVLIAARAH